MAPYEPDGAELGIAFALVIAAGCSTGIGASLVFFPRFVKYANPLTLAGAIGLSGGVMVFVSFVDIWDKAFGAFGDAGHDERNSFFYTTGTFFAGVFLVMLFGFVEHCLVGSQHHQLQELQFDASGNIQGGEDHGINDGNEEGEKKLPEGWEQAKDHSTGKVYYYNATLKRTSWDRPEAEADNAGGEPKFNYENDEEKAHLMRMSLKTAVAIALHNFPEGLATFMAYLSDPAVGIVLACAIAIHNVPEGVCVALPVFYATGNRCKAFGWAILSGISEPIAAVFGWAVLHNTWNDNIYGVLFGIVGGMMIMITVKELLPTAWRYDPDDRVVTYCFVLGMAIMALSLVLLNV